MILAENIERKVYVNQEDFVAFMALISFVFPLWIINEYYIYIYVYNTYVYVVMYVCACTVQYVYAILYM